MLMDEVVAVCKRRGIIQPSLDIYGGSAGFFDYGPLGARMRNNIISMMRGHFIDDEDCYEVNTPVVFPKKIWEASGHIESFTDPLVHCKKCGTQFRADHLIEDKLKKSAESMEIKEMNKHISKIDCLKCKGKLTDVRVFQLMFKTSIGSIQDEKSEAYLRPENAQGVFLMFKSVQKAMRVKLPFGIAQIGKCFRNEISPRNFVFRVREFTLMDLEFFVHPKRKDDVPAARWNKIKNTKATFLTIGEQKKKNPKTHTMTFDSASKRKIFNSKWHAYWLAKIWQFLEMTGADPKRLRLRQQMPDERSHYSADTWDCEAEYSFGWKEVIGCADRGNYDLSRHMKYSKQDLTYFDEETRERVLPHVIEPSPGIDRILYLSLEHGYIKEKERELFRLPAKIAPFVTGVFPLVNKQGMPKLAKKVYNDLKKLGFRAFYDESGSIGKRYRRMDEIGTPFCVTIDGKTLKDNTITLRHRDSMKQQRVKIEELGELLHKKIY